MASPEIQPRIRKDRLPKTVARALATAGIIGMITTSANAAYFTKPGVENQARERYPTIPAEVKSAKESIRKFDHQMRQSLLNAQSFPIFSAEDQQRITKEELLVEQDDLRIEYEDKLRRKRLPWYLLGMVGSSVVLAVGLSTLPRSRDKRRST